MSVLWLKEWRQFAPAWPTLALRLAGPALLLWPLIRHHTYGPIALGLAIGALGTLTTAAQVARERQVGIMPRLALTPVSPERLILHRILSRTLLLLGQLTPLLALAPWLAARAVPLSLAATAAGAWIGLAGTGRRTGVLVSLGLGLPAWAALAAAGPNDWAPWLAAALALAAALRTAETLYGYPAE